MQVLIGPEKIKLGEGDRPGSFTANRHFSVKFLFYKILRKIVSCALFLMVYII